MDMPTNNQEEQNCFICEKHKGNITVPGGAIYEDELVYVGHVHWDSEETKRFGLISSRVSKALKESEGAEHIYTFCFRKWCTTYAYAHHTALCKYTKRVLVTD